jgi:KH domain-containing RNA-binding signal transduction-associated protein 3
VAKAQAQTGGKPYKPEHRYVDIYKDKPIKLVTKVLVPVKEHPKVGIRS